MVPTQYVPGIVQELPDAADRRAWVADGLGNSTPHRQSYHWPDTSVFPSSRDT